MRQVSYVYDNTPTPMFPVIQAQT